MGKRLVGIAIVLILLIRIAIVPQVEFSVDPGGGAVLVVRTDERAHIALYDSDGTLAVYETDRLVLALEGSPFRVVVRGAREVFHGLYPRKAGHRGHRRRHGSGMAGSAPVQHKNRQKFAINFTKRGL